MTTITTSTLATPTILTRFSLGNSPLWALVLPWQPTSTMTKNSHSEHLYLVASVIFLASLFTYNLFLKYFQNPSNLQYFCCSSKYFYFCLLLLGMAYSYGMYFFMLYVFGGTNCIKNLYTCTVEYFTGVFFKFILTVMLYILLLWWTFLFLF